MRAERCLAIMLGAVLLALPAAAQESEDSAEAIELVCTEEASLGFLWDEEGEAAPSAFAPESYTVKIVSDSLRQIALPGLGLRFFDCAPTRDGQPGILTCTWQGQVFMFRGEDFTTAWLYSSPLGGDPNQALAYGHCVPR